MTHAEILRDNLLGIDVPSCEGRMELVQLDHVCDVVASGAENPRVIHVNQCLRCGDIVELSDGAVVDAGSPRAAITALPARALAEVLRPEAGPSAQWSSDRRDDPRRRSDSD